MLLKRYQKLGCSVVWANSKNHSDLLASTSINNINQNLSDIELLSIDFGDRSKQLNVHGKAVYNAPFRSLAWGTFGQKEETLPHGLIFGGMENGAYTLWNPAEMIGQLQDVPEDAIQDQKALLYAQQPDEEGYPILCAEWNNLKNNFLAFGSTSLLLLDVGKDITNPDIMKPSQGNPHQGSYISSVRWNKQVSHVLASAGSDGLIALWDIKTNKSIFQFKDSSPTTSYRQVEIAWSKHISTQIAVTLDDQKKNQLQIWDLRNQKGPIVVIDKVHTKGINSIDWSDTDPDLILASSRDKKVVCWNYTQDQTPINIKEFNTEINNVSWSHTLSSIYSVTTSNSVEIYSMDDKNLLSYVPKWLKNPAGSNFNGNDSLISYSETNANILQQFKIQTQAKKNIIDNIVQLQEYLQTKSIEGEEGSFWNLIATKKSEEEDSDIYDFLGFNKQKITKQVEKYTTIKRSAEKSTLKKNKVKKVDYIPFSQFESASFFGSLGSSTTKKRQQNQNEDKEQQNIKYDMVPLNYNWDIGKQKLIKQNMLIGNYEGAIDAALKCGRTAQALIIAYSIDQNTFNNTLKTFFTQTTDHFISDILKHIAFKDTEQLVSRYDIRKWKQCAALIYSISSSTKRKNLLKMLGERITAQKLTDDSMKQAGIYCFILADQFECIVQEYASRIQTGKNSERKANLVHYCTKLIAIYESSHVNVKRSTQFERILRETAMICLESGKKLASYNIFTTYLSHNSFKFIDYLINNTDELVEYRDNSVTVVNLPVMNKKTHPQADTKKKGNKKNIHNPSQQQLPTNMKPGRNYGKQPNFAEPLDEEEEPVKNNVAAYQEAAKIRNTPPPPPQKRPGPPVIPAFTPQDEQQQKKGPNVYNPSAIKSKKNQPPPPPKPLKNQSSDQTFSHEQKNVYHPPTPQSNRKGQPIHPSSGNVFQNQQNSSRVESRTNIPPPPNKPSQKIPPPPKKQLITRPSRQDQQNTSNINQNQGQTRNPPPPATQHKVPPPNKPKIPSRPSKPQQQSNNNPPKRPAKHIPQQQNTPYENYQSEESEDEQGAQIQQPMNYPTKPARMQPPTNPRTFSNNPAQEQKRGPPKNIGKGMPQPPKRAVKQESQYSEEQDTRADIPINNAKKIVPPPPSRKIPPAPVRR